jgi:hypothetical protein
MPAIMKGKENTMYTADDLVGKTVLIDGYRNDGELRVGKVLSVRDTENELISLKTKQREVMTRGRYLILVQDVHRNTTRSYYLAHCGEVSTLGWVGMTWHYILYYLGVRQLRC